MAAVLLVLLVLLQPWALALQALGLLASRHRCHRLPSCWAV